jgi:hypothetical protein
MRQLQALCPEQEVLGIAVISYKEALDNENFTPLYEKHGLTNIDPEQWYLYQTLLDVFNDIVEQQNGAMFNFVSIGMKIGEKVKFPPSLEKASLVDVLKGIMQVSNLNYRGSDIGFNKAEFPSGNHAVITYRSGMPDDVMYGMYYTHARRFLPKGTHFTVYFDKVLLRRDDGADWTTLHIEWD